MTADRPQRALPRAFARAASPALHDRRTTALRFALVLAAIAVGAVSYRLGVDGAIRQARYEAAAIVLLGWLFVGAGLIASRKRPESRIGALMTLFGLTVPLRNLIFDDSSLAFTVGFLFSIFPLAVLAHLFLAYPGGRLARGVERNYMKATYVLVLALPLGALLFYDPALYDAKTPLGCDPRAAPRCPESLLFVDGNPGVVEVFRGRLDAVVYLLLAAVFLGLLVRRLIRATPRVRRTIAPVYAIAFLLALDAIGATALDVRTYTESQLHMAFRALLEFAIPIAMLVGVLRSRLARAAVGDLVLELEGKPPGAVRAALARALGDPTLEVAFWLPERRSYVNAAGEPVSLPDGEDRAVAVLESAGQPVAALVHDPGLRDDPDLVAAAGAAARLALENARLHAEVRAQLAEVRRSRARIVSAADAERRRIERDLHDGAQQRLVALALGLKMAQRKQTADPEVDRVIAGAVDELQAAIGELRELARGIHPAVLTKHGLRPALESLAERTPVPVEIASAPSERLPPEIEAAAYYLACEGVTNAVKHAGATAITVSAERRDGHLVVEVADDGVGGARAEGGSGLRGLADRVEAHGGRLSLVSPPGGGTRIVGELPCGS